MTALAGRAIGSEVQVHEELGSTSDEVRQLGLAGHPHGLVVFAESQTAGRGRRDNRWTSQPGTDLAFSVLLRPESPMTEWPRITTMAALAICQAVESVTALRVFIKWPNDIYLQDRKCAGILAETFMGSTGAFMVLGIGVNVNSEDMPADLRATATSLRLATGQLVDRSGLAIALLKALDLQMRRLGAGFAEAVDEVQQRSWLVGKMLTARVEGREVRGLATGLDREGHLVVRDDLGVVLTLSSAEQVRPYP